MSENFNYSYSAERQSEIDTIRKKYLPESEQEDKMKKLRALDASVGTSALIISMAVGILSALIFGTGMCCFLLWDLYVLGALVCLIGVVGMLLALVVTIPAFGTPDLILPASLTEIQAETFEGAGMKAVLVPAQVTFIGARAFRNCARLERIRIPAGCTLGEDVFDGCGLVFVYSAAGSPAEAYCSDPAHSNCVFVQE